MTDVLSIHVEHRDDDYTLNIETPSQTTEGMSQIGYTPATCDPDDFVHSRYSLRNYGGDTELFIVMTMSDENESQFGRTMNSYVAKSLQSLQIGANTEPKSY